MEPLFDFEKIEEELRITYLLLKELTMDIAHCWDDQNQQDLLEEKERLELKIAEYRLAVRQLE